MIKVLTCNIRDVFDYEILADEVEKKSILVACFQEYPSAGPKRDKIIRAFKARGYSGLIFPSSTDIIFTSKDLSPADRGYVSFTNTTQQRGMIIYTFVLSGLEVKVCTAQLESGGTGGGIRKSQIRDINTIIGPSAANGAGVNSSVNDAGSPVIFAGDTNILSWQIELNNMTPGPTWLDAWREKGNGENEYTSSSTRDRMDRVWYTTSSGHTGLDPPVVLECISYDLFSPFPESTRNGVVIEIRLN